ncbi:MAG: FGGY-family carbohydrate kinase, partial [Enterobacteriaceae bacterium]
CRAAVEGATFGLRYGLDLFKQQGIVPDEIRLTGGGANSPLWRQIVADVMNCPVVVPREREAAALGAAIQAAWCDAVQQSTDKEQDNQALLAKLCQQFVAIDPTTRAVPENKAVNLYQVAYQHYLSLLQQTYPEMG